MSKIDFSIASRIDQSAVVLPIDLDEGFGAERVRLRALRREELAIARMCEVGMGWPYIAAGLLGFGLWLSLFPLCMMHMIDPWLACAIATVLAPAGYLIGHEAMHGNLGPRLGKYRWLNDLVGWIALVPVVLPFSTGRLTHQMHHAHCNDPLLDPDYCDEASGVWSALVKTWYNRQPGVRGSIHHYRLCLERIGTPEAMAAQRHSVILQLAFPAVLFAMAWSGYAIEAALVWWLPRQLALSYIRFTFSWAPHHPRSELQGRYGNTRVFRSPIGNLASMGLQYHIIHHLYPNILIHRNRAAFDAMRHVLEERGVDCSALPLAKVG